MQRASESSESSLDAETVRKQAGGQVRRYAGTLKAGRFKVQSNLTLVPERLPARVVSILFTLPSPHTQVLVAPFLAPSLSRRDRSR